MDSSEIIRRVRDNVDVLLFVHDGRASIIDMGSSRRKTDVRYDAAARASLSLRKISHNCWDGFPAR